MIIKNTDNKTFGLNFSRFNHIFPTKPATVQHSLSQESTELKPILQNSIKSFSDDCFVALEQQEQNSGKFLDEHPFFAFWAHFFD